MIRLNLGSVELVGVYRDQAEHNRRVVLTTSNTGAELVPDETMWTVRLSFEEALDLGLQLLMLLPEHRGLEAARTLEEHFQERCG